MVNWTFEGTRRGYGNMWRSMAIKPGRDTALAQQAVTKILSRETEYRDAFAGNGLPWYFGAAIHYREADNDFKGCMVNGEKIVGTNQRTTIVPENRGPYATFKDSVRDAADIKGWRNVTLWSIERFLFQSEIWNGLGYVSKGINAPFVWAGTNHEEMGLYVRDHVFDGTVEDKRLGTAAVIKALMEARSDIAALIVMETEGQDRPSPPPPPPSSFPPVLTQPTPPGQIDYMQIFKLFEMIGRMQAGGGVYLPPPSQPIVDVPAEPVKPPVAPPPVVTAPIVQKPSVQLSAGAFGISTLLQALGIVGMPVGSEATTAGTLSTIIPIVTGLVGMTGGWGSLLNVGLQLIGGLVSKK